MHRIKDGSLDLTVTSPPFSNLYVYSDALADMGNSADDAEFLAHFRFLAELMLLKTRPGRMAVLHCMDMPRFKQDHGRTGIYDFPGDLVRVMESAGWQFHSRVTIWKCPKAQMERTKSHGLLHVQLCKDSTRSRQGLADYLLVFRRWDDESAEIPVNGGDKRYRFRPGEYAGTEPPLPTEYADEKDPNRAYSIQVWRKYASPVWFDIDEMDVLDGRSGREPKDERHVCPLQLQVIARAIHLWSNPGDLVFDPFAGIGSTGYVALDLDRKFLGHELKESYIRQARSNLEAIGPGGQMSLLEVTA